MVDPTVKYYNENARLYYDSTVSVDMSAAYQPFLDLLPVGAKVLDAGCGSGRDSLFFRGLGFEVHAFDASEEMVRLSSKLLDQEVKLMRFEELDLSENYDGIWACSSLLHVDRQDLVSVISALADSLKEGGVFYMSFKYGDRQFWKDGRYFNCMDEGVFGTVIEQIPVLSLDRLCLTADVRPGREVEHWLNAYLIKTEKRL